MRHSLKPHPEHPGPAIEIYATAERTGAGLLLGYEVLGDIAALAVPPAAEPRRADELWQHMCFEAFVRQRSEPGYVELNFAPSLEWAAYAFDAHRSGMRELAVAPPVFRFEPQAERLQLHAEVALAGLAEDASWQVGLSVIVEEKSGRKSYWALAHPPGKADFHHPDSFALELPASS